MRHDPGDAVEIAIGGGVDIGQDVARIEDVEPLVLHRAEIEIFDRHNVEQVEVILAAIGLLVPRHRLLETGHRVRGLGEVLVLDPDAKLDLAPAHRGETVSVHRQVARDHREQIGRLRERVVPLGPVRPVSAFAPCGFVAVGEQHRIGRFVGAHPHRIDAQHVGPVGVEGDPAEALALALGAENPARGVKPHQLAVGGRRDLDLGGDGGAVPRDLHHQHRPVHRPGGILAIDLHRQRPSPIARQPQRPVVRAIALHRQRRAHPSRRGVEREVERHLGHQPVGRAVIGAEDGGVGRRRRGFGVHAGVGHGAPAKGANVSTQ